jgi:hypothetical protein
MPKQDLMDPDKEEMRIELWMDIQIALELVLGWERALARVQEGLAEARKKLGQAREKCSDAFPE